MPINKISVAPMMDWTDRHCRYFHRQLTKNTLLYTEMITADAIIHGCRERLLRYNEAEHPVALQLGGSDPKGLGEAAKIGEALGYDEINLNIGCPSPRVKKGGFGAALMYEPELVRDCISNMQNMVSIPVTVKCRIGVDEMDDNEGLDHFISVVAEANTQTFIIHARKAWLEGLSPKQNREVPPLNYDRVYKLKSSNPGLKVIINGGIETVDEVIKHLEFVDGVMIGRAAYHNPYMLSKIDNEIFGDEVQAKTEIDIALSMIPYIERELSSGTRLHQITRHMLGLFKGASGAKIYRRILSSEGTKQNASIDTYRSAIKCISHPEDQTAAVL